MPTGSTVRTDEHARTARGPGAHRRPRRRGATAVLALLLALVASGCHDEQRIREQIEEQRPSRLPIEPDEPSTIPTPALLDTIRPYESSDIVTTSDWQLVTMDVGDDRLWYRVPLQWVMRGDGRAANRDQVVHARAVVTAIDPEDLPLATYAAQLAEGSEITRYTTGDSGDIVYVTRREVSVAPSDPNAPREIFHSAVVVVDSSVVKLDVRYPMALDWRYTEVAHAIAGTIDVRHSAPRD